MWATRRRNEPTTTRKARVHFLAAWVLCSSSFAPRVIAQQQPFVELVKLAAGITDADDKLGDALALDGDRLLLGLAADKDDPPQTGSAYIVERDASGAWVVAAKLNLAGGSVGAGFGHSVALQGDRALIGAHSDDSPAQSAGSAAVFDRQPDGQWLQVASLKAADSEPGDHLGYSVALSGNAALVGAPNVGTNSPFAPSIGAAYVFERQPDGGWTQVARLEASDKQAYGDFGDSVALVGDRGLVGAKGTDPGGAVYVFERQPDGQWLEITKLQAANPATSLDFGTSVALGPERALIGAPSALTPFGIQRGAAWIFDRQPDDSWTQVAVLTPSFANLNTYFGDSVDLDGDRAIVGAFGEGLSGVAYGYEEQAGGMWVRTFKLFPVDGAYQERFGESVALSGDRALCGAPLDDDFGYFSGSAYLFDLHPLSSDTSSVSVGAGGEQPFDLDGGQVFAGFDYLLLGTASGTVPGMFLQGSHVPLNPDAYLHYSLNHPNTPPLVGSLGVLDAHGHATASFQLPAGLPATVVGLQLHHAFLVLPMGLGGAWVSNALALDLVP